MIPRVIIHNAVSVDGRVSGFMPDMGLYYGLARSFEEDATLSGADTILAGLEQFSEDFDAFEGGEAVIPGGSQDSLPLLVVTDSRGRVKAWERFLGMPFWRAGVSLCSRSTPSEHLAYLESAGVDVIVTGEDLVNLRLALEELNARYGVEKIRMDSGGTLNGAMLREGLVSEVSVLVSPCIVGLESIGALVDSPELELVRLELAGVEELKGGYVWLRFHVRQKENS
jgi:2,5-diamino-6-(ribosylamino)-4(3H)-pyrimidinone 5'-phosphate reductase